MKQGSFLGSMLIVLACVGMSSDAQAGISVSIVDSNFNGTETFTSSTPWVPYSGGGGYTIAETTSTSGFMQTIPGGAGAGVGYIQYGYNGGFGPSGPDYMYQILTVALVANSIYTLTGYIGNNGENPYSIGTPYVQLLAGSTVLASSNESFAANGDFYQWSVSYTAPLTGVPSGDLEIVLGLSGGNQGNTQYGEVNFADISLSYTPVPEPVNMALGIFAGPFILGSLWRTERVQKMFGKIAAP
jgi:hypothetical protein